MASYAQVEAILARINRIADTRMGAFRGRLAHFRRLGIVPASPGKGKRIDYALNDIRLWAFAIELAQFGVDPVTIKRIFDVYSAPIIIAFEHSSSSSKDTYLIFSPNSVTYPADDNVSTVWLLHQKDESLIDASTLKALLGKRGGFINVTMLQQAINRALDEVCTPAA